MLVVVLIALLGLAIVAASARPGDGRAETAIAVPLIAAVAVWTPAAAIAALGGAALAYAVVAAAAARTLVFGRRLRAIAACAGAVVPLGVLAAGAVASTTIAHPELWIVGAVVPGVLAHDVRRQPPERRLSIAIGGVSMLVALAFSGVVLRGSFVGASLGSMLEPASDPSVVGAPVAILVPVLLGAVAAGAVARWRYGLHVGPLSVPLVATWSLDGVAVPVAYLVAGALCGVAIATLQPRLCLSGRRLSTSVGLLGATVGGVAVVLGAPALPGVVAGALAGEDVRLWRGPAGADLVDALGIAGSLYALVAVWLLAATGVATSLSGVVGGLGAAVALAALGLILARRERERPTESQLAAAERRWVP